MHYSDTDMRNQHMNRNNSGSQQIASDAMHAGSKHIDGSQHAFAA